jgi:RNA polymerase sigma-54 factor
VNMRMRPQLQMRQSQQLVMTPQLQMAIRLLQLSRLELLETVRAELLENPVLEETAEPEDSTAVSIDQPADPGAEPPPVASDHTEEVGVLDLPEDMTAWSEYLDSGQAPPSDFPEEIEHPSFESTASRHESLQEHLAWQLRMSDLPIEEMRIGETLIGNVDDDGYLRGTVEEILGATRDAAGEAADGATGELLATGRRLLARIQQFDPPGVAAATLAECLLIQLGQLGLADSLPARLVAGHLEELSRGEAARVARSLKEPLADVEKAYAVIRALEPKPGRPFGADNSAYVTPDVFIAKVGGEWTILLNDEGLPRLGISSYYRELVKGGASLNPEAREFLMEKLRSATWLIKSIDQRQRTIYKVAKSILEQQRVFFEKGEQHLRPMVLRDVAGDIGVHESTVSRVTTHKYLYCPQGLFELKYFFNPGISAANGEMLASESVRAKIREIIKAEPAGRPLSDQAIAEILKGDGGIDLARRTVAKYREALNIPTSAQRRKK